MRRKKKQVRVWAAIEKSTGDVWMINDKLSELKADVGDDKRLRFAILKEERPK